MNGYLESSPMLPNEPSCSYHTNGTSSNEDPRDINAVFLQLREMQEMHDKQQKKIEELEMKIKQPTASPIANVSNGSRTLPSNTKTFKVLLCGQYGVGKTSLIRQYVQKRFIHTLPSTVLVDFSRKKVMVNDKLIILDIYDTPGFTSSYTNGITFFRQMDCCVLVYDVTRPESFNALGNCRSEFLIQASPRDPENFPFIVIGNKIDSIDRLVSLEKAKRWCQTNGIFTHFECSAKNSINIEQAFQTVARLVLQKEVDAEKFKTERKELKDMACNLQNKRNKKLQVIMLGNYGVGKSALLKRYVKGEFQSYYQTTIQTDHFQKEVMIHDQQVTMQVYDTSGMERFAKMGSSYYRDANCGILVFDLTKPRTFNKMIESQEICLQNIRVYCPPNERHFPFVVIGNKIDLENEREISSQNAKAWCQANGNVPYFECSAKNDVNVTKAFQAAAEAALRMKMTDVSSRGSASSEGFKLSNGSPPSKKKSGGCGGGGGCCQ